MTDTRVLKLSSSTSLTRVSRVEPPFIHPSVVLREVGRVKAISISGAMVMCQLCVYGLCSHCFVEC